MKNLIIFEKTDGIYEYKAQPFCFRLYSALIIPVRSRGVYTSH